MKEIGNQDRQEVGRLSPKNASTHALFYNHFSLDRQINRGEMFKSMRNAALSESC